MRQPRIVGHAEVADLPAADELADRADGFLERRAEVVLVQVVDVDVVGGEAREAVVAGCSIQRRDRPPSCGFFVITLPTLVARIQSRRCALIGRADDALGRALRVDVGGVDEIDARVARLVDDRAPTPPRPCGRRTSSCRDKAAKPSRPLSPSRCVHCHRSDRRVELRAFALHGAPARSRAWRPSSRPIPP